MTWFGTVSASILRLWTSKCHSRNDFPSGCEEIMDLSAENKGGVESRPRRTTGFVPYPMGILQNLNDARPLPESFVITDRKSG